MWKNLLLFLIVILIHFMMHAQQQILGDFSNPLTWSPHITADSNGNLYTIDSVAQRVNRTAWRKKHRETLPVQTSLLTHPNALALSGDSGLYIAGKGRIVYHDFRSQTTTVIVGSGWPGNGGDFGPAIEADVNPQALALNRKGDLIILDEDVYDHTRYVRIIDQTGEIAPYPFQADYMISGSNSLLYLIQQSQYPTMTFVQTVSLEPDGTLVNLGQFGWTTELTQKAMKSTVCIDGAGRMQISPRYSSYLKRIQYADAKERQPDVNKSEYLMENSAALNCTQTNDCTALYVSGIAIKRGSTLTLRNLSGQIVHFDTIGGSGSLIPLPNGINAGIYLAQIWTEGQPSAARKVWIK